MVTQVQPPPPPRAISSLMREPECVHKPVSVPRYRGVSSSTYIAPMAGRGCLALINCAAPDLVVCFPGINPGTRIQRELPANFLSPVLVTLMAINSDSQAQVVPPHPTSRPPLHPVLVLRYVHLSIYTLNFTYQEQNQGLEEGPNDLQARNSNTAVHDSGYMYRLVGVEEEKARDGCLIFKCLFSDCDDGFICANPILCPHFSAYSKSRAIDIVPM